MYANRSERELICDIIRADFGRVPQLIAQVLLLSEELKMSEIYKHVRDASDGAAVALSEINASEVLHRLHFPAFIKQAKSKFGKAGEVIMEDMLVLGRVRLDQSLDNMAYRLAEYMQKCDGVGPSSVVKEKSIEGHRENIYATFVEMAKNRYISRVHPVSMPTNESLKKEKTEATHQVSRSVQGGIKAPRKVANVNQEPNLSLPVELTLLLETEELSKNEGTSEEKQAVQSVSGSLVPQKRKYTKKAKLPNSGKPIEHLQRNTETKVTSSDNITSNMQCLVWRFGVDQLVRELRHQACIKFAKENVNHVAGIIVEAMLNFSMPHERDRNEATSFPISAKKLYDSSQVKGAFPEEIKDPWRLLLNYLSVMCRDKSGMLIKTAAEKAVAGGKKKGDGGEYAVHMKNIIDYLKKCTIQSFIREKYGIQTARIVCLLSDKHQLEQKTIGELTLLPSNEARRRLYQLYKEKLIQLQEIPKRADHNPVHTLFTWSLQYARLESSIRERIEDSICKIRARREFEALESEDLIARSSQLVEANDLEKFDKLCQSLDRLDLAILQLDEVLMLLRDF